MAGLHATDRGDRKEKFLFLASAAGHSLCPGDCGSAMSCLLSNGKKKGGDGGHGTTLSPKEPALVLPSFGHMDLK